MGDSNKWKLVLASVIVLIDLVLAAVLVVVLLHKRQNPSDVVIENIMSRTSIREYSEQEVDARTVETLLRAAMAAPSAGNKQPWRFVVIDDRAVLDSCAANYRTMEPLKTAPLAVVVCGDMRATFPRDGVDYWVEDTSAAAENLLLAAHGLGLGAVWLGVYPLPERVIFLKDLLSLPEHIVPMGIMSVGRPAEDPQPKDKWNPDYIHQNVWDSSRDAAPERPW